MLLKLLSLLNSIFYSNMLDPEFSITTAQGNVVTKSRFTSGELIFEDNFEKFNSDIWLREPSNQAHITEFQLFCDSPENSYVHNGVLHIAPTFSNESDDSDFINSFRKKKFVRDQFHPIRSSRLSTKESFSFTYGTLEFRARNPSGDWLFPALWLLPKNLEYGPWPVSGEIDVMESRGNKNLVDSSGHLVGAQRFGSTLHWGPNKTEDQWKLSHLEEENATCFSSDFHIYRMKWTPQNIMFSVDNLDCGTITPPSGGFWELGHFSGDDNPWKNGTNLAPFDKEFYLVMNLAVGGVNFFSDSYTNEGGKPWNNSSPNAARDFWDGRNQWLPTWNLPSDDSHFLIDYVKVWAL
ncbi:hypothetical protein ABEB36_012192 [Hypothenemus hampei]|uniref:Beta-1,3 glucan binding protein (Beta-GBP) isoform X1 n=1 Tax=Hypothenemus hampei TaxID=57062 RepID=A0AAU8BSJ5_HYPHA